MHPGEASHGDLGMVAEGDVVLALSNSGEAEEILTIVPVLKRQGNALIAMTGRPASSMAKLADVHLDARVDEEACPLGLAPTASTTAMMAVGDALALLVSRMRGFSPEDFALYHPGGSLGRTLMRVEDVMRTGRRIRRAAVDETVRAVFVRLAGPRRRSGAVLVVDPGDRLLGIFTDSDLVRLFEARREGDLDLPIGSVMTAGPFRVAVGSPLGEAVELMKAHKISELPVVDRDDRLAGLIDVTDLIGVSAADFEE
jgi:arabinose-5-phosphate isomerase